MAAKRANPSLAAAILSLARTSFCRATMPAPAFAVQVPFSQADATEERVLVESPALALLRIVHRGSPTLVEWPVCQEWVAPSPRSRWGCRASIGTLEDGSRCPTTHPDLRLVVQVGPNLAGPPRTAPCPGSALPKADHRLEGSVVISHGRHPWDGKQDCAGLVRSPIRSGATVALIPAEAGRHAEPPQTRTTTAAHPVACPELFSWARAIRRHHSDH